MKIKTKKKMTPEEYAKYMIDKHGIRGYESELIENNIIDAPKIFSQKFELNPTSKEDLLTGSFRNGEVTVEVEEEITEDTVIPKLIEVYLNDANNTFAEPHRDRTIKQIQDEGGCKSLAFYTLNDDLTMTLIWRDGKLVE